MITQHARANRQKASTTLAKETILANHLYPRLGDHRLDPITDERIENLKADLSRKAPRGPRQDARGPGWGGFPSR
jgi:hypothetical protein